MSREEGIRWSSLDTEEKRAEFLSFLSEDQSDFLGKLDKKFHFAEMPVINGDPEATLQNISDAMSEVKEQKTSSVSAAASEGRAAKEEVFEPGS